MLLATLLRTLTQEPLRMRRPVRLGDMIATPGMGFLKFEPDDAQDLAAHRNIFHYMTSRLALLSRRLPRTLHNQQYRAYASKPKMDTSLQYTLERREELKENVDEILKEIDAVKPAGSKVSLSLQLAAPLWQL